MSYEAIRFAKVVGSILLMTVLGVGSLYADNQNGQSNSPATPPDIRGTWSGTFFSKHPNVTSFSITVVINQDEHGAFIGSSSLNSDCLKGVHLQVSVTGPKVVLAGSDDDGNNITVRGILDGSGTLIKSTYILNGSATGHCETDNGSGNLAKR